jgi:hypothetical protein
MGSVDAALHRLVLGLQLVPTWQSMSLKQALPPTDTEFGHPAKQKTSAIALH